MNKLFYPKLAWQNLRNNAKFYFPYILTVVFSAASFYIMLSLNGNADNLPERVRYAYLSEFVAIGIFVVALFSIIFLFYTNSFLMKKRNKEIALYNILGMGKRHIAKVLAFESLYTAVFGIGGGIVVGFVFQKLVAMLLYRLMRFDVYYDFYIFGFGIGVTAVIFGLILFVNLIFNLLRIHLAKPIELLHSGSAGEKEPKTKWFLTVIGIAALGAGYYIAVTTQNAIDALSLYFIAVFLVIIGTYCLFTSISIFVLKLLRKNKKLYYKTNNFISISGMLYRMKRNAVGLANICILCTGVLVVLSSTVSLYAGIEEIIGNHYPRDIMTSYLYEEHIEDDVDEDWTGKHHYDYALVEQKLAERAKQYHVEVQDVEHYYEYGVTGTMSGTCFVADNNWNLDVEDYLALQIASQEDYNALTGANISLDSGTVLLYCSADKMISGNEITVGEQTWQVAGKLDGNPFEEAFNNTYGEIFMVVPSLQDLLDISSMLQGDFTDGSVVAPVYHINFNLEGSAEDKSAYCDGLRNFLNDTGISHLYSVDNIYTARPEIFGIYGGLFFVGIFIGTLFLITTVMIIYYKQISEGYDDRERFGIMQKVGMSKAETKSVIRNQILQVFFMPILLAVVHICFAFKIIRDLLVMLEFTNVTLFVICTIGTILIFTVVYFIVYWMTARTYYRITSQADA